MKESKFFAGLALFFLFFFFLTPRVLAADLEVNFEDDPLFSQAADGDWLPGRSETKQVTVANNSSDDKTVIVETYNYKITTDPAWNLADVLELTINDGTADVYGGSLGTKYLTDFYGEMELALTILLAGHAVTYDFTVALADSIGNPWQNRDTGFDLRVGFYGVAVASTPTTGFVPILGAATETGLEGENGEEEMFLGEAVGPKAINVCPWWWILLLLQVIIQVAYCFLKRETRFWWAFPLLVSIVNFFIHKKLHQGYLPSRFCSYFWLGSFLILVFTVSFQKKPRDYT